MQRQTKEKFLRTVLHMVLQCVNCCTYTSTAPNYYTALKFTSNSSFTAAQRPKRILAILEGIFYGRAAADEIFSDSRSAFLLPIGQHSGVRMDHWLGAAHTPKPASLSTGGLARHN